MPTVKIMKDVGAEMAAGMMAGTERDFQVLLKNLHLLNEFERAKASARRVFGLLDTPNTILNPVHPVQLKQPKGHITLQNVHFHYKPDQEILRGIPGLADEVVDQILEARVDGSESLTRNFETWLAVEGFLTMDEMRALLPLVTCGGDVYKAQIIGYMEGNSAFSRIEAVISGAGDVPQILFFRRMDHLGRGFDIPTLGQRFDAGVPGGTLMY